MMKERQIYKAFTFIEVIIYIAIASVFALVLVQFIASTLNTGNAVLAIQETEAEANSVLTRIDVYLRSATSVITPAAGNNSSNIIFDSSIATTNPVSIQQSSGVLESREGTSGAYVSLHSENVALTNMDFWNITPSGETLPIIRYAFTLTHDSGNYSQTYYGTTTAQY